MISAYEALFQKYREKVLIPPPAGCWRNYLGLATDAAMFAHGSALEGRIIESSPFPDDQAYGTDSEHAAVLAAIDLAVQSDRKSFSMMELGSGWGPWISQAGIVCAREGFETIKLVGVEADPNKYDAMVMHFKRNGLLDNSRIKTHFMQGAAWSENTILHFPKITFHDWGGAASESSLEYRGGNLEMQEVQAWGLEDICATLDTVVDVGHWDVQGAELNIALASCDFLDSRVRSLQIGTHSRLVEGELLRLFHQMGWDVIVQKPCDMQYDRNKPTLEGMTTRDGELQVRNPKLWI